MRKAPARYDSRVAVASMLLEAMGISAASSSDQASETQLALAQLPRLQVFKSREKEQMQPQVTPHPLSC
jgi:hypothetical protein